MDTITQIIGGSPGQVQLLTLNRVDNDAVVVLSPALPQPFTTSDDATFIITFTDPSGECELGYTFTYNVSTLSPGATFPTITTLTGSTGPDPDTGSPTTIPVSGTVVDERGNVVPNVDVAFRAKYTINELSATSDSSGEVTISLIAGEDYAWRDKEGSWNYFTTPTTGSLALPNMVGEWQ